ncbi:MAG: histidine phosphatase family protein [Clostridia bacterium]|nr:histidine phosphatase family protein [Clostridia bacterium]
MKILIIRHGEPDYSIDSLTEKGWREAELLADRLARLDIRDFYCSPLGRARDTARPTMRRLGREDDLTILPWLREFHGAVVSPFEERKRIPWNLMPQFWTKQPELFLRDGWLEHPLMRTGDVARVYRETQEGLDALLAGYGYTRDDLIFRCERNITDTIALFCHFGLGMAIASLLTGTPLPLLWQGFFMPTSSVTTFVTEERLPGEVFFKCMQLGDTSHLYAAGEPVSRSGLFHESLEAEKAGDVNEAR